MTSKDGLFKVGLPMTRKMPETCGYFGCSRKCTHFWGEVADLWACDGHYIIMNSNYESLSIPKDAEGEYVKEAVQLWAEHRKAGIKWLKEHPNPAGGNK